MALHHSKLWNFFVLTFTRVLTPLCRCSGNPHLQSKSKKCIAASNEPHLPTSTAAGHTKRALSYIALTSQVLQQHDIHQSSSYRDAELEYIQADQVRRIKHGLDSLSVRLDHAMHAKLHHGPLGGTPMERFQDSPSSPQFNQDHDLSRRVNYTIAAQSPAQEHTHGSSSIVVNQGHEDMKYAVRHSADVVVFAPEPQYHVPASAYAHDVAAPGNDLASIGMQFTHILALHQQRLCVGVIRESFDSVARD
jgi:hypothetical protein